jgi:hypothetical protein
MAGTAAVAEWSWGAPVDVRESAIRAAEGRAAAIPVAATPVVVTQAVATVTTKNH